MKFSPYLLAIAIALRFSRSFSKVFDFVGKSTVVASVVSAHHDKISKNENSSIQAQSASVDRVKEGLPKVSETAQISVSSPSTLPDYLLQNNELIKALLEQQANTSKQLEYQNTINLDLLRVHSSSMVYMETISRVLNSTLPAMVIQLQDVAKIAGAISIKSDIETAYSEQGLANHAELIKTLKGLKLSPSINPSVNVQSDSSAITALTDATTAQKDALVASLEAMNLTAFYEKGVLNVTNEVPTPSVTITNDNVAVEALKTATDSQTAELSAIKSFLGIVSDNATAQKKVALHQTTVRDILNLDGNVVATASPLEAHAMKNIVDAKNATDEMEFEVPEDILGGVFSPLVLPSYTSSNFFDTMNKIKAEDALLKKKG